MGKISNHDKEDSTIIIRETTAAIGLDNQSDGNSMMANWFDQIDIKSEQDLIAGGVIGFCIWVDRIQWFLYN